MSHADKITEAVGAPDNPTERRPGPFRIGSLFVETPVVLAPMAAITDVTYRRICREMGAGLTVTEAAYAHRLLDDDEFTWRLTERPPDETPLLTQLYGRDPEIMAAAAERLESKGAEGIDLNCGCPMPKIVKKGIGAALLREPGTIGAIIRAIRSRCDLPVTAKIRAGWEQSEVAQIGRELEHAGVAAIAVHGRTRSDRYSPHADWDSIAELVETVEVPVIGNGDVDGADSAARMFAHTGCAGVMVGRAAIGNPWVIGEIASWLQSDRSVGLDATTDREALMLRHFRANVDRYGETAFRTFRKHLLAYVRDTQAEHHVRERLREATSEARVESLIREACKLLRAGDS